MDSYQVTSMVLAKLQALEPENASKIMGFILIQDPGQKEMIRLALGPDNLLQNHIVQAKSCLGISSNTLSSSPSSSPTPFNPISRPNSNRNPFSSLTSPRAFNSIGFNSVNPSLSSSDFRNPNGNLSNNCPISPDSGSTLNSSAAATATGLSYAAAVANNNSGGGSVNVNAGGSSSMLSSDSVYDLIGGGGNNGGGDMFDEYKLQDHLAFLKEGKDEELMFNDPRNKMLINDGNTNNPLHRRSVSFNDACYGAGSLEGDVSGFGGGYTPCTYFSKGFCKNGSTCDFRNGGFGDSSNVSVIVGSLSKQEAFEKSQEILRSRAALQQQRMAMAPQLTSSASFPYNKCMNFFNDNPRSAAAAASLMMCDEFHKFSRCRSDSSIGLGGINPVSRQIYLTFPADSTFRDDDVSDYFSIYGQVQDVRIPYQQKRMFGFVTFVYPETVKLILAKGNPHFVCDSRVLVKPYKEKGKVEKKQYQQQQHFDKGELSSPRDSYDIHIGPRMFYNAQELMLRRKIEEQADLQQAIGRQGRRMMNLQLLDIKNHQQNHHFEQILSPMDPFSFRISPPSDMNQNLIPSDRTHQELTGVDSTSLKAADKQVHEEVNMGSKNENTGCENGNAKEESSNLSEFGNGSLERTFLPDNFFASPTKSAGDNKTVFTAPTSKETDETSTNTTTTLLDLPKSRFYELPRYPSGHEVIEM